MKQNLKILLCYNSPVSVYSVYNGKPDEEQGELNDLSETNLASEINNIQKELSNYYSEVIIYPVDSNISKFIKDVKEINPDVIFNSVESIEGISTFESCFAGLIELFDFPYTGNTPQALANCLNKDLAKKILKAFDVITPSSQVYKINEEIKNQLNYPVILKLANEDASIGISENSVVHNDEELRNHLQFLQKEYKQDVLAEEYIEGREFNIAILDDKPLPVSEIKFDGLPESFPKIVTYDGKWIADSVYYINTVPECPANISEEIKNKLYETAVKAYEALSCRDYARVDIRLSRDNTPYVIEVNPNPDISTDSGFARAAKAAGITYAELLYKISQCPIKRKDNDKINKAV